MEQASGSEAAEVDRRVATKTFPMISSFLKHVKDILERSWQDEREALWETGIRRWIVLVDQWEAGDSLLLLAIQSKQNFTKKAQVLVDVF